MQEILLGTIRRGINFAALMTWITSGIICQVLFGWNEEIAWKVFACVSVGLVSGMLIGFFTGIFYIFDFFFICLYVCVCVVCFYSYLLLFLLIYFCVCMK